MGVEQQRPCLLQLVKENWEEITANGQRHHFHFLHQWRWWCQRGCRQWSDIRARKGPVLTPRHWTLYQNHLLVLKRCCIISRLKIQQLLRVNCDGLTSQFFTNMFNPLDLSKQKKLLDLVYIYPWGTREGMNNFFFEKKCFCETPYWWLLECIQN